MATGGMGDTLAGVIASLAAQGLTPFAAANLGVLVHAQAGDMAAAELGMTAVLAGDVGERTGRALERLRSQTFKPHLIL
jgi:NAD(P)H-hydrate epimerase